MKTLERLLLFLSVIIGITMLWAQQPSAPPSVPGGAPRTPAFETPHSAPSRSSVTTNSNSKSEIPIENTNAISRRDPEYRSDREIRSEFRPGFTNDYVTNRFGTNLPSGGSTNAPSTNSPSKD